MKRRNLLALLGGAALAGPMAGVAQQPAGVPRVGVLMGIGENDPEAGYEPLKPMSHRN